MKKWLIAISVLFLICLLEGYHIFYVIHNYQEKEDRIAIKEAKASVDLSSIDHVTSFYGKVAYHVVAAKNKKGHIVYVWVPDKKGKGHILMEDATAGITKSKVLQKMKTQFPYKKIFSVHLGIKDSQPVWAVSYLTKDNHYSVSYFDFFTGESMTIIIT